MRRIWIAFGISFIPKLHAACIAEHNETIQQRYNENNYTYESFCKVWPATGHLIAATSIRGSDTSDLDVLVIDSTTGQVIAETRELNVFDDGAIYSDGFRIDTAPYRLSADVLAFGIRISWRGSSQPNPYNAETLNLYIVQDSKLIKVLNGLSAYESIGEWDLRCKGEFITAKTSLHMKPLIGGYSDVLLKKTTEQSESRMTTEGCKTSITSSKRRSYTLHFEKDKYEVPKQLLFHMN